MADRTVEEEWKALWEPIIIKDGEIDVEQLKKELADFSQLMEEVSKVYSEITGQRISKPNTMAFEVIAEFKDQLQSSYDSGFEDAKEVYGIEPGVW